MNHHFQKTNQAGGSELKAINRKRFWIVVTSLFALLVFAIAMIHATPTAVVIVAIIILISLKKAAISYKALGKNKAELLST